MNNSVSFTPIAIYHCESKFKHELPRQGVFNTFNEGTIVFEKGFNYEQGLRHLENFDRIWLIFALDRNTKWKPIVSPPVKAQGIKKVGVFATRSPYRPNMIGLSCVRLLKIDKHIIHVCEADLLDNTPILDIKPYIPSVDSFPNASAGWVDNQIINKFEIVESDLFKHQNELLVSQNACNLLTVAQVQLGTNPIGCKNKRIKYNATTNTGVFSYRMFRIIFHVEEKTIILSKIISGYTEEELGCDTDIYHDKDMHRYLLTITQAYETKNK